MQCTYYFLLLFALIFAVCGPLYSAQEETVETKIKTMLFDPTTDAPVVVLETVGDKKLVPIRIDIPEARAIALELQHVQPPPPLHPRSYSQHPPEPRRNFGARHHHEHSKQHLFRSSPSPTQRGRVSDRLPAERCDCRGSPDEGAHLCLCTGLSQIQAGAGP